MEEEEEKKKDINTVEIHWTKNPQRNRSMWFA